MNALVIPSAVEESQIPLPLSNADMPNRAIFVGSAILCVACCTAAAAQQQPPSGIPPFEKPFLDQVGAAWYRAVQTNSKNITPGTIRIAFTALPDGKISGLRVLSNTSNNLFARICIGAIKQAKLPPVPPTLLKDGKFKNEISFEMRE